MDNISDLELRPTSKDKPQKFFFKGVIILAILAILFAIKVPGFVRDRSGGQFTACKSNLKNLSTALDMYSTDHQAQYPPSLQALTPNYLKIIPECPAAGTNSYQVAFGAQAPLNKGQMEDYFLMWCEGSHHGNVGCPKNFPKLSNLRGLMIEPSELTQD